MLRLIEAMLKAGSYGKGQLFPKQLGVEVHPQKTRIVHVQEGFEFLGYMIKRGVQTASSPAKDPKSGPTGCAVCVPRVRSPSSGSWIRYVNAPDGGYL